LTSFGVSFNLVFLIAAVSPETWRGLGAVDAETDETALLLKKSHSLATDLVSSIPPTETEQVGHVRDTHTAILCDSRLVFSHTMMNLFSILHILAFVDDGAL
jgi:hypothetical protein